MHNTQIAEMKCATADQITARVRLKKWRVIGIVFGLIPPIGYIILNIVYNVFSANSGGFGWVLIMALAPVLIIGFGACLVMTIISFVKMITYSRRSNNSRRALDVMIGVLAILSVFSPFLISGIWVSVLRNNAISNPYYYTGRSGLNCDSRVKGYEGDAYTVVVGCMVADYYTIYGEYPTENRIRSYMAKRYPDFSREGYGLVIDSGDKPNRVDFVIQYGVNCKGETKSEETGEDYTKGFSIYSPLYEASYGDNQRTCIPFNPD